MSLVVGHSCPRCGLDSSSVACDACGGAIVWDRQNGSRCGACGLAASTFCCSECGMRAELDRRQPGYAAEASAPTEPSPSPPAETAAKPVRARLALLAAALASSPMRTHAFVALAGAHGVLIALLVGGLGDIRQTPRDVVTASAPAAAPVPDRLNRGVVELSPDAKPVPLTLPAPSAAPMPPLPTARVEPTPPPVVITRADTGYRPPPQRDVWWQRALRSGRASAPSANHLPADTAGIGR